MNGGRGSIVKIITHAMAFALGWFVWKGSVKAKVAGGEDGRVSGYRSGERAERRSSPSGESILTELIGPAPESTGKKGLGVREEAQRLLDEARDVDPAADHVRAFAEMIEGVSGLADQEGAAMDELSKKSVIRLIHWMRDDPSAAIAAVAGIEDEELRRVFNSHLTAAANALVISEGPEAGIQWLKLNRRGFGDSFKERIIWLLGESGDPARIEGVKGELQEMKLWEDFLKGSLSYWPMEKAERLMEVAKAEASPHLVADFALAKGNDGALWLQNLLESGRLDPADKDAIANGYDYASLVSRSPGLDFDTRLEVLARFNPDKTSEQLAAELAGNDVSAVLKKGRDLRYAFRSGELTAEQVHAAVAAELPMLSAKAADALRDQVFMELAEENGSRALALLDQLPEERKWEVAMKSTGKMFRDVNPQQFYDYLQNIPADAGAESLNQRALAWANLGRSNHARLGANYLDWVRALPEGLDKDLASLSLVESIGVNHSGADEFAAAIKDPKIRQRIPWKP